MEYSRSKALIQAFLSSDGFWAINKCLARHIGFAETAYLMELVYGDDTYEHDQNGYFPYPQDDIEWKTGISLKSQKRYCNKLEKLNLVQTKHQGVPSQKWYQINYDRIIDYIIEKFIEDKKRRNKNGQNVQSTKNRQNGQSDQTSLDIDKMSKQEQSESPDIKEDDQEVKERKDNTQQIFQNSEEEIDLTTQVEEIKAYYEQKNNLNEQQKAKAIQMTIETLKEKREETKK